MIFMWFLARSSRGTGPKIRAGTGRLVDDDGGRLVKADDRAVLALDVLAVPHDDANDVALLHAAARDGFLHGGDDCVADRGVAALGAAQHLDAHDPAGARIIGHFQVSLHLDHKIRSSDYEAEALERT